MIILKGVSRSKVLHVLQIHPYFYWAVVIQLPLDNQELDSPLMPVVSIDSGKWGHHIAK